MKNTTLKIVNLDYDIDRDRAMEHVYWECVGDEPGYIYEITIFSIEVQASDSNEVFKYEDTGTLPDNLIKQFGKGVVLELEEWQSKLLKATTEIDCRKHLHIKIKEK